MPTPSLKTADVDVTAERKEHKMHWGQFKNAALIHIFFAFKNVRCGAL